MNIMMLTTHINTGGIGTYLLTLTRELTLLGVKVFIVSSGGDLEKNFLSQNVECITLDIRTKSELSPKIYFNLGKVKKHIIKNNIQCIHAHTRVTQVMGEILSKMTDRKYCSTCHGFFKPKLSRRIFSCWGERVIAISEAVKRHLINDFTVPDSKIALIPNGIDLECFPLITSDTRLKVRKQFDVKSGIVFGNIGRLSDVKGQDILIKAMPQVLKALPNAQLLIVGQGKWENHLKQLTQSLNLKDAVHFYPVVNNTYHMLSLFDIFVMPSRQEGLGLAVMEAQAAGLPVIASSVGGLTSIVENNRTGYLVKPEDADELARVMIDVGRDLEKTKPIADNAHHAAHAKYSSRLMGEKTLKLYKELIYSK